MIDYARPIATVDVALFTIHSEALAVAVALRDRAPFKGVPALIGGYVHVDEDIDLDATARRVLLEKTGVQVPYLEQLGTFSGADRDPRGWSLSVAYYALVPESVLQSYPDTGLVLTPVEEIPDLGFDHKRIVATAVGRLRSKGSYSSLPAFLLPETFSLSELKRAYEQVTGATLETSSFRKKIFDQKIIEPVAGSLRRGQFRPTQLYRLAERRLAQFYRTI
jgi:hypothetical protein